MTTDQDITAVMAELAEAKKQLAELSEAARYLSQMEEPGWSELGSGNWDALIAQSIRRDDINRNARWYYYNDPIPNHAVALHNAYTFGRGVSFKAADPDIHAWLERFWSSPRNQHSISRAAAQWVLNRDRQLDGELFFVFYTSTLTGRVTVRTFDPSAIVSVVTVPGDPTFPVYFQREYVPQVFDFASGEYKRGKPQREYLPDWRNAGPHGGTVRWPGRTEVHVMHVLSNPLGGRGLSHLATALPWVKAYKGFMEDRVTLTMALALFAFKQKVKGNRQAVARMADQWGNYETAMRYGVGDGRERRQGANTLIENDAANLEQLKTDSGASNAYTDARMLKQQAGIGAGGIFEHYFGDPSTGNLATATAMELPMLKLFEFEQQLWEDIFRDVFTFVVLQGVRYGQLRSKATVDVDASGGSPLWSLDAIGDVDLSIDVTLPPIVQSDIAVRASALASVAQAESMTGQAILPPKNKALEALRMFGVDNAGEIVDEMEQAGFVFAGTGDEHPAAVPTRTGADDVPPETLSSTVGLNGAQIDAAMRVLAGVQEGTMAPSVAVALLTSLGIEQDRADAMVRDTKKQPRPVGDDAVVGEQQEALREADKSDDPPEVGKPLPKDDALKVDKITKSEVDQYFDAFAAMPDLDDLLDQMGLSLEDVDEAARDA